MRNQLGQVGKTGLDWQVETDLVGQVDGDPWSENAAKSGHRAAGSDGRCSAEEY
jgi:hypothetical protein